MAATNQQVQQFVDTRIRPRCEQIRNLIAAVQDDIANIGDVYANLTSSPTWTDGRTDAPPHLMTPSDVLAVNTCYAAIVALLGGTDTAAMQQFAGQWPIVEKACVRPLLG